MKQNANYLFSIRVLIFLTLFIQQFSIQFANAQDYSLNNELISLSFGQQGIRSLTDKRLNKTFTFSSDQFLISLNGKIFDSLTAKFEDITASANKLTYTYRIPDFTLKMRH